MELKLDSIESPPTHADWAAVLDDCSRGPGGAKGKPNAIADAKSALITADI
jgi:hypothetical protein